MAKPGVPKEALEWKDRAQDRKAWAEEEENWVERKLLQFRPEAKTIGRSSRKVWQERMVERRRKPGRQLASLQVVRHL